MKLNAKVLALMTALSAGVATAATTNTTAGTSITNVATATFTDPSTGSTASSTSNEVKTTVLPLPSFDMVYGGNSPADGGGVAANPANSISPTTPVLKPNILPGATVTQAYDLVNTGNTPLNVTVTANTTGSAAGETVTYTYTDVNGNPLTVNPDGTITLPVDNPATAGDEGVVKVIQTIVIPANAAANADYGASPQASLAGTGTGTTGNGVTTGQTLYENQTVTNGTPSATPANGTDLQFTAIKIVKPDLSNDPVGGTTPPATTVTAPGTTTPVPGYTDPGGTPIVVPVSGGTTTDNQIAYPKADANGTPDSVTFTNTVKNSGPLADPVNIYPTDTAGNPIGTFNSTTGEFTLPSGAKVTFLDPATGLPLPVGADGYPTLTVAPGTSANYLTKVTYPDSNTVPNPAPIVVTVGVDSGLIAGISTANTTTDTVLPPATQFGDTAAQTTGPLTEVPAYVQTQTGAPGATVPFAMSVANTGTYTDTFTLSGYVVVPLADGTSVIVPVVYSGTGVTQTGTRTVTDPGTGLTATIPVYTTSNVAADSALPVTASVTVPARGATDPITGLPYTADAAATPTTASQPLLQQTATGVYSTASITDNNDPLNISPVGGVVIGKFTNTNAGLASGGVNPAANAEKVSGNPGIASAGAPSPVQVGNPAGYTAVNTTTYLPQVPYDYQIIAKNTYNTPIAAFILSDAMPKNTTFVSVTGATSVSGGTLIYNTGANCTATGTGWSTTAPTSGVAAGTSTTNGGTVCVALSNGAATPAPAALPSGQTITLDLTVKIN